MLCFEIQFPAGRYHATPWGAHVNEGQVEWPPSPWRILRALLSVGYTRLWDGAVPEAATSLLEKLGRVLPHYRLPPVVHGHSRHYMPIGGSPAKLNTTKVIDAFAYLGAEKLHVGYPGEFSDEERALARDLCERLPYLGRAESWVIARVLEPSSESSFNCAPLEPGSATKASERVDLLAPQPPADFAAWRARSLERAWTERLATKAEEAAAKGKKPPTSLSKTDQAKVAASFPTSWVDALGWDTATLQRLGWDMPPGARWAAYALPRARVAAASRPMRERAEHIDTALLALSADARRSDLLPPLRDAIRRADAIHATLVKLADPAGRPGSAAVLTGKQDGVPLRGHRHAHLLPLSLACRPDRFDHVLVHAPMGLDDASREALGAIRKTYAKGLPDIFVTLAGLGTREDFDNQVSEVRRAPVWRSRTPFSPPRFLKRTGKNSLRGQIERELDERGLRGLIQVAIELDDERFVPLEAFEPGMRPSLRFRHFRLDRNDHAPPTRGGYSLELRFDSPVRGPIALGYGCHFGLGLFAPLER
ncbi:MAG: type I-U CRISPR-associated protein Cas5/Cas6 [Labilithrix sp.]|nr:type I-U CRISPR-associated protein Cas5/Cas6 [Labilithrix sp.]